MNPNGENLVPLLTAMLDGQMSDVDQERLADLLRDDSAAQETYIDLCWTHALLRRELGVSGETPFMSDGVSTEAGQIGEPLPVVFIEPSPQSHTSPFSLSSAFGGALFSYGVSAMIVGAMLLGAWAYKISIIQECNNSVANVTVPNEHVGRITGMKDCHWTDPADAPFVGSFIRLRRRFELDSGLLEITYTTGARVILEGPCEYRVDSYVGGYLAMGKLTALVEERRVTREERGVADAKPQAADPQSPTPEPRAPSPQPLFAVTTPTAVVTDLGTEFGVEVDESGSTTSHVFRGSVKVRTTGDDKQEVLLRANESARVSRVRETHQGATVLELVRSTHPTPTPKFVRNIVQPPKRIDLLDIVAGGNGLGNKRECGIDPSTGMEDSMFQIEYRENGWRFTPVAWNEMIDGVFMPDSRDGSVQVDSTGHKFGGFPETDGRQFGSIWSRAAEVGQVREKITRSWVYSMVNDAQFMPERRGLLVFYANTGVTFDLGALRKIHSNIWPTRFQAVAGLADGEHSNPEDFGQVDLWVLVDGQLKFKQEKLRVSDGVVKLDVELAPNDHFLTLAVSDGGNGISLDCVVFGDPVLEAASTKNRKEGQLSK